MQNEIAFAVVWREFLRTDIVIGFKFHFAGSLFVRGGNGFLVGGFNQFNGVGGSQVRKARAVGAHVIHGKHTRGGDGALELDSALHIINNIVYPAG